MIFKNHVKAFCWNSAACVFHIRYRQFPHEIRVTPLFFNLILSLQFSRYAPMVLGDLYIGFVSSFLECARFCPLSLSYMVGMPFGVNSYIHWGLDVIFLGFDSFFYRVSAVGCCCSKVHLLCFSSCLFCCRFLCVRGIDLAVIVGSLLVLFVLGDNVLLQAGIYQYMLVFVYWML